MAATTDTLILYPISGRGHIVSMLEFGKLIHKHHPNFSITVIISKRPKNHQTPGSDNLPAAYPSINFHYLPPPPEPATTAAGSGWALFSLDRLNSQSLHATLSAISESTNLRAFIIDFFNTPAFEVAAGLHIPTYYYFTSGANGLATCLYLPALSRTISQSFKDLGRQLLHIPGLPSSITASDVPGRMRDRASTSYQDALEIADCMAKSSGIIVNTCESLESRALAAIRDGSCIPEGPIPPLFTIGPVVETKHGADPVERHESLQWLDSQPSGPVVFLCFGSMGAFSRTQLKEMATGLERSGVKFLWVVRPPTPEDKTGFAFSVDESLSLESILPDGFLERTRDRGFVVKSWAPQVDVLRHGSVGGFVTHCGWNSILEAVSAAVPMVTWPLYAEQKVNRAFLVDEAKIAIRLAEESEEEGFVSADEMERRVTELMMGSEIGEALRKNVAAMRDAVVAATADAGTSHMNLAKLAEIFKQN